jgi:hypothetical protein
MTRTDAIEERGEDPEKYRRHGFPNNEYPKWDRERHSARRWIKPSPPARCCFRNRILEVPRPLLAAIVRVEG